MLSTLKMIHFLLLQKLARVPLKNRFRLAIVVLGKCKYILLIENVRTHNYLQRNCKYIQGLSRGFRQLSLVILGYRWLSTILIYVNSFAHWQLSFPSFAEIFYSRGQIKLPGGNQR